MTKFSGLFLYIRSCLQLLMTVNAMQR